MRKRRNRLSVPRDANEELRVEMLLIGTPVWLTEDSPAQQLFGNAPRGDPVVFLGSTVTKPEAGTVPAHQFSDWTGRLSRALPLFLGEHVHFATDATTHAMIPWIASRGGGFMVRGVPWDDEEATGMVQSAESAPQCVVVTHVDASREPWTIAARVVRPIDGKVLATANAKFAREANPYGELSKLAATISEALVEHADARPVTPAEHYEVPAASFADYTLRLEQLLAVRCASLDGVPKSFLTGAREIIDGNIRLCLDNPTNVTARLVLFATCRAMHRTHPEVMGEFRERIARLTREYPLAGAAQSVVERLHTEVIQA